MEKYFIVTEESQLHKDWFAYKKNSAAVRELIKAFFSEHGIESNEFYAADDAIYIVPSEKDKGTFNSLLCAPLENGLRQFKKTSKISKAWVKTLKDAGLRVFGKPMLILYFRSLGGRFKSRLFDLNGILYCSLDPVHGEAPEGFVEMKASEFFKIIEESESVTV